jgi:hypothetical protein
MREMPTKVVYNTSIFLTLDRRRQIGARPSLEAGPRSIAGDDGDGDDLIRGWGVSWNLRLAYDDRRFFKTRKNLPAGRRHRGGDLRVMKIGGDPRA